MASFTNFCCRSGGSNLNAGTRTGNTTEPGTSADFTYSLGAWVNATRTFTVASGNPSTDGVAAGDYVALDTTGSAPATFGGRVSSVTATTIVVSSTANWGTNPANGTYTLRVGGAWQGPNGTSGFPLSQGMSNATNATGDLCRINLKNDQTYSITAAISLATQCVSVHGYSSSYGDLGRATIDGGTSGSSYVLVTFGASTPPVWYDSLVFSNNGATGSAAGLSNAASAVQLTRSVVANVRGHGITNSLGLMLHEVEVYGANQSNTASTSGLNSTGRVTCVRCILHDNTGSNTRGATVTGTAAFLGCIFDSNGQHGLVFGATNGGVISGCDFYKNAGDGLNSTAMVVVENCNFLKNGDTASEYGVNASGVYMLLMNNGFGSGTQANSGGQTNLVSAIEVGSITYATDVTPWTDPANGDFRINLSAAKGTGRGNFTQTAASYAGSVAFPDVGSNQTNSGAVVAVPPNFGIRTGGKL